MFQNLTPITKNIIAINVIVYILSNFFRFPFLYEIFPLFYPTSPYFHWWQPITHMFMHASFRMEGSGIIHILFNMMTLASFGPLLERMLGVRKFLILYFLSGVGSFLLDFGWKFIQIQNGADASLIEMMQMIGASGAISGVVAAFATYFPEAPLSMMFIPIPIKAKYLIGGFVLISIYLGFSGNVGGIAHFAHVGGAIVGFLLAKYWKQNQYRIY